jgi:hypothetical protein
MKKRPFRKYTRGSYWIQQRNAAFARAGETCEVTGGHLRWWPHAIGKDAIWKRACHHIIGERWARAWVPGCDPHCLGNLVVITPGLHAKVTAAEKHLCETDILGYKQELNRLGVDPVLFERALTALCQSVKK